MSEPKIDVAPPAGAVMIVTVPALTFSLFGMVHMSSAFGAGGRSGAACDAVMAGSKLAIIPDARRRVIKRIAVPPILFHGAGAMVGARLRRKQGRIVSRPRRRPTTGSIAR